ncbi:A-kinase anchor protein 14 [Mugil cephalus]|uniref:A-kinase anchor protein 14 n=1 Tax=Mugil cephalus TaxID=48193 RepID=UPI001FB76481|nr:A-kinase anchor protein 14 [Mugil cephalus]
MDQYSQDLGYPAESAQLVKSLLEAHRHTKEESCSHGETEIHWAACKDFTIEKGKGQIDDYIKTWKIQPHWLHSVDFLCSTEEENQTFYHYRARFSTPSPRKPIQGTASVYFAMELSKVKPQTVPVQVRFIIESNRLVHTPGKTTFREKWLVDVIESKTLLREMVDI